MAEVRGIRLLLRRLLLLCVSVLVTLGVLEAALRLFAPSSDHFFIWPPFLHRTFHPDPEAVPGVQGASEFRVNSKGLRADELGPDHSVRILALGGSTTECMILDQQEAWPRMLQQLLNDEREGEPVWVGNAGRSGHSSREHVFQLPRLLDAYPDTRLVIVLLGANDLGLRLQRDEDYDPRFLEREGVDQRQVPRAFSVYPLDFAGELPIYKRLELYARARQIKDLVSTLVLKRSHIQDEAGSVFQAWRANRANAVRLRDRLPDLGPALEEYASNLRRLVAEARERQVRLLFLTQPSLLRRDLSDRERGLLWWGGVGDFQQEDARTDYYSVAALVEGTERYNRALVRLCRDEGVDCFDLAGVVPRTTHHFYDDFHFTEAGSALVAETLAAHLSKAGWLTPAKMRD